MEVPGMHSDDPQPAEIAHLLLVRGGQVGTIRAALDRLGVGVEVLACPGEMVSAGPRGSAAEPLRVGSLVIDRAAHEARLAGRRIDCTPTEFRLLAHLAERPGTVLSRRQLLQHVRGSADYLTERTVDSHIANLRRKLDGGCDLPALLVTVYGVGYKLRAERPHLEAVRSAG
ncbi:MAG: hypothetical protein QOG80_2246 [Pseudonocardiales bacterium]|jgi:DNA-binding response OmpR family regulator|nr:hypothetical protein [Pseudonocardiales bacterium]